MKRLAAVIGVLLAGLIAAVVPVLPGQAWEHCNTDHPEKDCKTTTTPSETTPTTHPSTTTSTGTVVTLPEESTTSTVTATTAPQETTVCIEARGCEVLPQELPNTGSSSSTGPLAVVGGALLFAGVGLAVRKPKRP